MKYPLRPTLAAALAVVLLLIAGTVEAGTTGKISGVVEDVNTGAPLVGATVRVLGTNLITKTDEDGEYFIINLPVGKYDLAVTHVGFEYLTKKEVRILLDLTTPVDFELEEAVAQLSDPVVVYATNQVVQKDLTESRVTFTSDRLQELPNTVTVEAILGNYPGVVEGRDRQLHIRGGRSGQVTYYYDGFSVQDPFVMASGIRIMPSALEELSLSSGGFGAEYGDALSGIVNAVTPEGGSEYHGRLRGYEGFTHQYDVNTATWSKSLNRLGNRSMSFNLRGPIPGLDKENFNFFTAGEYLRNNSYLPHNWAISYSGVAKLTLRPISNLKLTTNFTYFDESGDIYDHRDANGRSYDFNLDGLPAFERKAYLAGVSTSYYFNERTIATASANRFSTKFKKAPRHLFDSHYTDWPGYSVDANGVYNGTIHESNYGNDLDNTDPYQVHGFTTGDDFDPTYSVRETMYDALAGSLIRQLNKSNQIKVGFEWRKYDITKDFRQFYNAKPYAETFTSRPVYASAYIQNKVEYSHVVVNAGLRWSYRDSDMRYNSTPGGNITWTQSEAKSHLSPRLGVSFPVSDASVMHFNYGLYYQTPQFTYLYFNPQGDVNSGLPLLGNPDLLPEQTTSYELGLDHLINDGLRLDVTAYHKDIQGLVTTRQTKYSTTVVTRFNNDDYGSVQGIDLELQKLPGTGVFSASVSYTYMQASGNGSNALEPYYNFGTDDSALPVTEYPLDFDQRHTVTAVADWRFPEEWKGNLVGLTIPGHWGLSMVGYFGSGLPYTRTDSDGNRLGERNEDRLPANYVIDMRFNKHFRLSSGSLVTFFFEVDNLLDRRNVLNVYTRTGLPDDDAVDRGTNLATRQDEADEANRLYDHNPLNFSAPRTIRSGFELSF